MIYTTSYSFRVKKNRIERTITLQPKNLRQKFKVVNTPPNNQNRLLRGGFHNAFQEECLLPLISVPKLGYFPRVLICNMAHYTHALRISIKIAKRNLCFAIMVVEC